MPVAHRDGDGVDWALVTNQLEFTAVIDDFANLDFLLGFSVLLFSIFLLH